MRNFIQFVIHSAPEMLNVTSQTKCLTFSIFAFICYIIFTLAYVSIGPPADLETEEKNMLWNGVLRKNISSYCSGYGIRNITRNKSQGCKKRLPNCLIIGVPKAGTMALLWFLSSHPQVVRNPKINEYHFFSEKYDKGLDWYKDLMPYSLPGQVVIEKSPSYFRTPEAPERIFQMNPHIKLMLIVREPVQRALSSYLMGKRKSEKNKKANWKNESFEASWRHFATTYDDDFEVWLKYFKQKQIHVVDGDAMTANPIAELSKIESFLNIDHYFDDSVIIFNEEKGFYCQKKTDSSIISGADMMECLPEGKGHIHPNISETVEKEMKEYFLPYNKRFYQLSGRQFDWDTIN